ncbi:MAG: sigma-70 family RNA polymerase sigma factor [Phycisphaeraceae bacterium]|nr:sigma-70 family RNA polymerase sigma factor [Phycisphaeraceae bacterium]
MHHSEQPFDTRSLADLAAAAAQGNAAAFEALHKRLSGGLRKLFVERSGGRSDVADDLIQRTWVGVWQALRSGRYDPARSAISTFVYAVGHNMWLQHLRSRAAGRSEVDTEHEAVFTGPDSDLAEVLEAIRACLRGEAGGLTPDERVILRLSGTGSSDRDLAARLSVSPSTANARKRAAFDKLRRHLESLGHHPDVAERLMPGSQ